MHWGVDFGEANLWHPRTEYNTDLSLIILNTETFNPDVNLTCYSTLLCHYVTDM